MSAISQALNQLRQGGMVILVDDEDRENEGDLVVAAQFATPAAVNFMATHGRGLICLALTGDQIDRLQLPAMASVNRGRRSTAFTVSIEARDGITTGISAFDRSRTILAAMDPAAKPGDIVSPGHVFPLRAAEGGVLTRNGHTEGATDLMRLAGLDPAAAICEIMREDGEMARRPDLERFAAQHNLPVLTIADLVAHRRQNEPMVEQVAVADLPSSLSGKATRIHAFKSLIDGAEHLAMVNGPISEVPLVRVHSECLTGDALGSLRCDCGSQLQKSLQLIGEAGGVLIYLRGQEGRGIGLANKIRAYALQDHGRDTVEANTDLGFTADARNYAVAAQILRALEIDKIRLLTNNPKKAEALQANGIAVQEQQPLIIASNPYNQRYLHTKRNKMGHVLTPQT